MRFNIALGDEYNDSKSSKVIQLHNICRQQAYKRLHSVLPSIAAMLHDTAHQHCSLSTALV